MARCDAFSNRIVALTFTALLNASWFVPAQAFTVEDIVAAWNLHSGRIDCIEYKATQTRKERVFEPTSDDQLGYGGKEDAMSPVTLTGSLQFIKARDRLAFHRSSEVWNPKESKKDVLQQHFCFDGTQNLSYVGGVPASVGQITPSKVPDDHVINNVEIIPLWWAHFPATQVIQAGDFSLDDLKITGLQDQKHLLMEVISRSNKELIYFLSVDPTNGFRITNAKMQHRGKKLLDLDIEYVDDDAAGWRVAAWDCISVNGLSISTKVTEFKVNESVPDDAFVVQFPVGTEMVQSQTFQFLPEKYQNYKDQ